MKIKKLFIMFLFVLMSVCIQIPVMASENKEIIHMENGDYIEIEIDTISTRNVNYITGSKRFTYKNSYGEVLWILKITGSFTYNGERANCESAYITTESYDTNWKVTNEDCYRFGSTAYGEATFTRYAFGIVCGSVEEKISLTCNENGDLS